MSHTLHGTSEQPLVCIFTISDTLYMHVIDLEYIAIISDTCIIIIKIIVF